MALAEIVMATGWTWDEARSLPYHAYCSLKRYWREVAPPTHISAASFAGFKPKASPQRETPANAAPSSMEEIFGAFKGDPNAPAREVKLEPKTFKF